MDVLFKLLALYLVSAQSERKYSAENSFTSVEVQYQSKSLTFTMPCEPQCEFSQEHQELSLMLKSGIYNDLSNPLEAKSSSVCENYRIFTKPLENFNLDIVVRVINEGDCNPYIVECQNMKPYPVLLQIPKTKLTYLIPAIGAILINEHIKNHSLNIGILFESKVKKRTSRSLLTCDCGYGCRGTYGSTCYSCSDFCSACMAIVNPKVGYLSGLRMYSCDSVATCFSNCATCGNSCSVCNNGFGLGTGGCVCIDGCTACYPGCKTCSDGSGSGSAYCVECEKGYFLVSWGCLKCPSYCADCTSTQCLECVTGILTSGTCTDCTSIEPYSISGVCVNCDSECQTCEAANICLTCIDSNSDPSPTKGCVCREKFYSTTSLTVDGSCKACHVACESCTQENLCTTCLVSKSTASDCNCKTGYYFFGYSGDDICAKCDEECQSCSESDKCLSCIDSNAIPDETKGCVCKNGYYSKQSLTYDGACMIRCNNNCKDCTDNLKCSTCIDSNAIPDSKIGCKCKNGYYNTTSLTKDSTCQACSSECLTCSDLKNCTSCEDPNTSLTSEGECKCNKKYYKKNTEGKVTCEACNPECSSCSSSKSCNSCISSFTFVSRSGKCVCDPGYYNVSALVEEASCLKCSENCLTCSMNPDSCTSCSNNLFLYKNSCIKNCPEGFKGEKNVCVECLQKDCEELNSESDSSSSSTSNADYMSFTKGASYYPFSISTVGTMIVMIGFKLIFTSMQAAPLLLSLSGIMSTCCGGFIFACLVYSTTPGHSKRLLLILNQVMEKLM